METPPATLHTIDDKPVLRFERRLAHPPSKVWRAVTEPTELSQWFPAKVSTDLAVGARMRFTFEDDDTGIDETGFETGEILEYDPPKVYAFRWADSVLRFELLPDGDGCLLIFTQVLPGTGTHDDLPSAARHGSGWHICLDVLAGQLDGQQVNITEDSWFAYAEQYVAAFGLGEGTVEPIDAGHLVRFERDLVQPVAAVWQLLTGGSELHTGDEPPVQLTHGYVPTGTLTEITAGQAIEYSWLHDDKAVGRVRFECRDQQPIGTRLFVTHTLPDHLAELRATVLAAWQTHLELFFAALHGDVRCPWPADRTEELRQMYASRLTGQVDPRG